MLNADEAVCKISSGYLDGSSLTLPFPEPGLEAGDMAENSSGRGPELSC